MSALPPSFVEQMNRLLGSEAERFLASYGDPRTYGLRLNPLKLGEDAFHSTLADKLRRLFGLTPVPWCATGYYYDPATRPGKHPYHQAGLLYMQEPSAMSAAELLRPAPGEVVLDLAAAPGGKTTQLASFLRGEGLLVANEIHPARAKVLSENIERLGITNAVACNAAPDALAARFPDTFDRIMLDAPCSGEGMFRKDPDAIREWSPDHVRMCAARQLDILQAAAAMLKPGGTLAYSTCTFNQTENEQVIASFVGERPEFDVARIERIWPHKQIGEGHFVALLRKNGTNSDLGVQARGSRKRMRQKNALSGGGGVREAARQVEAMLAEAAPGFAMPEGELALFGDQLYALPSVSAAPARQDCWDGIRVLRPGLHLATLKKGRAEPTHSLALALTAKHCSGVLNLEADDPALTAYLNGSTLPVDGQLAGWTLVAVDGFPLGWGKASGGQLKNHYPKGLRRPGAS